MIRSKLSDLEKQAIVSSFEQQKETIPGLAERYQVSASTIRRLLKQGIPDVIVPAPAREAVGEKADREATPSVEPRSGEVPSPSSKGFGKMPKPIPRSARSPKTISDGSLAQSGAEDGGELSIPADPTPTPPVQRASRRGRGMAAQISPEMVPLGEAGRDVLPASMAEATPPQEELTAILEDLSRSIRPFADAVEDESEDEDEADADAFEDGYDPDEEELGDLPLTASSLHLQPEALLEVLPLAEAVLPKTCYLVVDRTSELVTRPLKDFGDLGQIPEDEIQSCTLPVFDNGHIARRFSHRTQRVIKVPNGNMLRAACTQLSAKGITRLLINGRIYAL